MMIILLLQFVFMSPSRTGTSSRAGRTLALPLLVGRIKKLTLSLLKYLHEAAHVHTSALRIVNACSLKEAWIITFSWQDTSGIYGGLMHCTLSIFGPTTLF